MHWLKYKNLGRSAAGNENSLRILEQELDFSSNSRQAKGYGILPQEDCYVCLKIIGFVKFTDQAV